MITVSKERGTSHWRIILSVRSDVSRSDTVVATVTHTVDDDKSTARAEIVRQAIEAAETSRAP